MEIYNQNSFSILGVVNDNDPRLLKNAEDTYDVYVNEEYIGKKILLTQTESIEAVRDFLKRQGVDNVSTNLTGDHYIIQTDDTDRVKKIIEVYLQNR